MNPRSPQTWVFTFDPLTSRHQHHAELIDSLRGQTNVGAVVHPYHKPTYPFAAVADQLRYLGPLVFYLGTMLDRTLMCYSKQDLHALRNHPTHILVGDQYGPTLHPDQQHPKGCEAGYQQLHGVIYRDNELAYRAMRVSRRRCAVWNGPAQTEALLDMTATILASKRANHIGPNDRPWGYPTP